MKRSSFAALLVLPVLSACSGLGQGSSGVVPQRASAPLTADTTAGEAPSNAVRLPLAPLLPASSLLYVANAGNNSITVYHANALGDTAPIATIMGSNTQLNDPGQLSEDAVGNLYVANLGAQSILVFAHGTNGNVAPVQDISGPLTGLSEGLGTAAVDQATGRIFAVAFAPDPPDPGDSDLIRFPLNANGDEAPLAMGPCCSSTLELTSDSTRKKFIYASLGVCCHVWYRGIYTAEKFPNGGHFSATDIFAFSPGGIADDPTTKTFLVSGYDGVTQGIFRFQEGTVGSGDFGTGSPPPYPSYTPPVVSVITSDNCAGQLALGSDRSIYAAYPCGAGAVYVYQHDASGNAPPLRVLTGSATQLAGPTGIYVGK